MLFNENIIPYVPIAPRVQASNPKSQLLCEKLFEMIDRCVKAQITFNHDTAKGLLSVSPDQLNDLLREVSKNDGKTKDLDIDVLKQSLNDLIYPKFNGELTVISPIWNQEDIRVWQFQLNQIDRANPMQTLDKELLLDQTLSNLRIWRQSLEAAGNDKDVTYSNNDLIYKLMELEHKLELVQSQIEE
ncbi:hypothetical protein I0P11_07525 [Acinetobacter baumannii]|uniref:hypothetical protein n=1 Tax=Acinetobacter baumannii TaxID=470 RepID=UPI0018B0105B|nr:hypothetical protein [Acinetobacter baumannii]MBF9260988.1 hypothetical protein [Acinetobacter baumannii]